MTNLDDVGYVMTYIKITHRSTGKRHKKRKLVFIYFILVSKVKNTVLIT